MANVMRSVLYAPANRPDLVAKMPRHRPDAVVIDLEDGTPESAKVEARPLALEGARILKDAGYQGTIWLRVNSPSTEWIEGDLVIGASGEFFGVAVPKVENADQVRAIESTSVVVGAPNLSVMWGIETVLGAYNAVPILAASARAYAGYFGAEDYIADLGGHRTRTSEETLVARTEVSIACRLAGVTALDQVVLNISDADHFRTDSRYGMNLGYRGKNCIHPSQIALCHEVYTPDEASIARARRLLECYDEAISSGRGTVNFEGQMVDTPLVTQAQSVIDLATAANG